MELCTTRGLPASPLIPTSSHRLLSKPTHLRFYPSLQFASFQGVVGQKMRMVRAISEESSSSEEKSERVATLEDGPSVDNDITLDKASPVNENVYSESREWAPPPPQPQAQEGSGSESESDEEAQFFQVFLDNFNLKLDSGDSYQIFLYGGGVLVAAWLLSAIVSSIDAIPVFPKLMEVVGLGYSVWFTTRYLLFKKSREELSAKIDELKQEVLGSSDK